MAGNIRNLLLRDGRYFARKVIPEELRPFFDGKTEFRRPLGPDKRTAQNALHAVIAEWNEQIDDARRRLHGDRIELSLGIRANYPLTIEQMAIAHYFSELNHDSASRAYPHQEKIADISATRPAFRKVLIRAAAGAAQNDEMAATIGWAVEIFRQRGNHNAEYGSEEWRTIAMKLAAAQLEAIAREDERNEGNFSGEPVHPVLANAKSNEIVQEPISIIGLYEGYLKEREAAGKGHGARKRWTPVFKKLVSQLGHDDANRLTKADIIAWKDRSLAAGLSPRTIKAVNLAALNAVLRWAVANDKISDNPAEKVSIRVDRKPSTRERGFRNDEAVAILRFARAHRQKGRESPKLASAKRWAPLLCALTGARVGEILQLRRQDVFEKDGIWAIRITPEAGTVKAGGHRDVPLHDQIIAEGFLDFVKDTAIGPLFLNTTNGAPPRTAVDTAQGRLRNWLSSHDLIPVGVQPNHAWRHRFKTIGRENGIDSRILDAMQGHSGRTAGDSYGDVTLRAMKNAIDRMPAITLDEKDGEKPHVIAS